MSGRLPWYACALLSASALSCTGNDRPATARAPAGPASPASAKPIAIGATMSLSGSESTSGKKFRDGYELAFAEAAARGGLKIGNSLVPVELKLLDDGSDTATAVRLARQLVEQDHVAALLSTYGTKMVLEQSTVAEDLHVPYVCSGASASGVFKRGYKYLFGVQAPTEQMAYAEMRWIDNEQKAGRLPTPLRLAIAWENTAFGKDYRAGVLDFATRTQARKVAYEVVLDRPFELGTAAFGPLVSDLKAAKAHAFLASPHFEDFIAMQKAVRAARICLPVISYGARGWEPSALEALGKDGLSSLIFATWWSNKVDGPLNRAFIEAFSARYHHLPEYPEALGYESARVLFAAMEKAGSTAPDEVRSALEKISIPTLLPGGVLSFPTDSGHQARTLYVVHQNQADGSQPIVYPRELATTSGAIQTCPSSGATARR
jgi:branched-chain amino acid transport system substrate-binding protein